MIIRQLISLLLLTSLIASCKQDSSTKSTTDSPNKQYVSSITNERIALTSGEEIMIPDHKDVVIIVRHAEKLKDDSNNPKLSADGQARASRLTEMVSNAGINLVFSTPYFRTLHTVSDIAAAQGIKVTPYQPAGIPKIAKEITDNGKADRVIIVGHSNTVHATVNQLVGKAMYKNPLTDSDYDHMYVVVLDDSPVVHALYYQ